MEPWQRFVFSVLISLLAGGGLAFLFWRAEQMRALHARASADAYARQLTEIRDERDYWKTRAEQLIDLGLMRANVAPNPIMAPPVAKRPDRATALVAGMAISEIDSREGTPSARGV